MSAGGEVVSKVSCSCGSWREGGLINGGRCKTVMVEVTELDKYQGYT